MTRAPAPELSPAEAARVAAFDAAQVPPEADPEVIDAVAHAMVLEAARSGSWDSHRLAAAAIAALPPSPAEQAVKRVAGELENEADRCSDIVARIALRDAANRVRDALASPAPAPQGGEQS